MIRSFRQLGGFLTALCIVFSAVAPAYAEETRTSSASGLTTAADSAQRSGESASFTSRSITIDPEDPETVRYTEPVPEETQPSETASAQTSPADAALAETEPVEVSEEYYEEDGVPCQEFPLYSQLDYPNKRFGSGTVATSGCGITSLAMVATYLTGHAY